MDGELNQQQSAKRQPTRITVVQCSFRQKATAEAGNSLRCSEECVAEGYTLTRFRRMVSNTLGTAQAFLPNDCSLVPEWLRESLRHLFCSVDLGLVLNQQPNSCRVSIHGSQI